MPPKTKLSTVKPPTSKPSNAKAPAAKPTVVKPPPIEVPATIQCTENIAVLNILHKVPSQPSSNAATAIQSKEAGYLIPFEDERRLTSTLAFLAYREDDPDHIPAVCVYGTGKKKKKGLKILLAVNRKGSSDKWKRYADYVIEGFDRIAAILKGADDRPQSTEDEVFVNIVELCKTRILCRLRLEKKKKGFPNKQRTNIIDGLKPVVEYLHNNPSENTRLFLSRAQGVLKLSGSYMAHQTNEELEDLIEGINSLRQTEKFEDILRVALSHDPNPITRSYLSNMIRKVARYREAARILRRLACRLPPVRRMLVEIVELPSDALERPSIDSKYRGSIKSTISRIPNLKSSLKDVKKMCHLLELSAEEADARFDDRFKNISKESKVHAEIQLLYHCETVLQGSTLQPRVICSSKSACWLCNAFLLFHGKIHTPRSHGRLYTGWRLPNPKSGWCNDIATRFNRHLESKMAESLRILHQRQKRTNYPEPVGESELSIITWLSSHEIPEDELSPDNVAPIKELKQPIVITVRDLSKQSEQVTVLEKTIAPPEKVLDEDALHSPPASAEKISPEPLATVEAVALASLVEVCRAPSDTYSVPQEHPAAINNSSKSSSTTKEASNAQSSPSDTSLVASEAKSPSVVTQSSSQASSSDSKGATRKQAMTYSVTLGEVSPVYASGPLKIQFGYTGKLQQQGQGKDSRKQLCCKAEWLSPQDVELFRMRGVTAVDIGRLTEEEVSYSTDSDNNIYLGHGEGLLKLTMRPAQ
ncbi:hypothetical protein NPX13_g2826 [Xylaria arbuscula]|uniref:Uncharacterized protein n=1 Tax=Xylaria arbuscula TaxID=114810 RepID=A0A9W8NIG4_9PEZI|nr:hypothetical protein NPX13_g2826 [Xylaria arbuscula]